MKKWISFLLCLAIISLGAPGFAEEAGGWDAEALKVASTTQMSGQFFSDLWGNNTADMDVRALLHGYQTIAWTEEGNFGVDETVVKQIDAVDEKAGRTYTFVLNDGLTFSDGTAITARDYVFSVLILSDPRLTDLGGVAGAFSHLSGFDAYRESVLAAEPAAFSGVRLLSDMEFSLTISKENLPYFYELMLVSVTPYPMGEIAPDCDVADDGSGAYITGPLTKELLTESVLNPETGYAHRPRVNSGPYTLYEYDRENQVARFERNDLYKGNYAGLKPIIEKIVFSHADQTVMFDLLASGQLDVVNKVSSGERIAEGMARMNSDEVMGASYVRTGLSSLNFACEGGVTASANVRKAIAMCVDQDALVNGFLRGFGLAAYGYYGYGQWMAAESQEVLLNYARYQLNLNAAIELLEADGFTLNALGEAYDDEVGGTRYKRTEEGELIPLVVKWAFPSGTDAVPYLKAMLEENLPMVGIELISEEMPFSELLPYYYRQRQRTYDMFFMATNFSQLFDPYYTYSTDDAYQGLFNTSGLKDEKLMKLADEMRKTPSGDLDKYKERWLAFQDQWIEDLPLVPLYSNIYFDFYRPDLQEFYPNANWSWAVALNGAFIGEPVEPVKTDTAIENGDDEGLVFEDDEDEELVFD